MQAGRTSDDRASSPLSSTFFVLVVAIVSPGIGCLPEPSLLPTHAPDGPAAEKGREQAQAGGTVPAAAKWEPWIFPGDTEAGGTVVGTSPADRLLRAIGEAQSEVWVTMYLLTSPIMVDALVAARGSGCDVRVLLEAAPYGAETANHPAAARLAAAGVDVRILRRPDGLVHEKAMIIDRRSVFVLSLNFTTAGLGSNREYAVVDSDPADVARAAAVFEADLLGGDPTPAPPAGGSHVLVSPIDARSRLAAAIADARASLRIEMEEFSDAPLAAAVLAAWQRGVSVALVAPARGRSFGTDVTLARLQAAGMNVTFLETPVVHAKAMVIDRATVYIGSINFTRASLDDNRELGLLLPDQASAERVVETIESDARAGSPAGFDWGPARLSPSAP
jgi:phosphatidylserine/phosphatidylglycerophosphate/cardiolipin synthase-like enzyme